MTTVDRHAAFIRLLRGSKSIEWRGAREFQSELLLSEDLRHYLVMLYNYDAVSDILVEGCRLTNGPLTIEVGKKVTFSATLPTATKVEAIVQNFSDLFTYDIFFSDTPKKFYCWKDDSEELPQSYKDVVKFAGLVCKVADHEEKSGHKSICFLHSGAKLRIPIAFTQDDLCELSGLEELTQSFCAPHYSERVKFFRAVLAKVGMDTPNDTQLFPHLVQKFTTIQRTFENDWNAYISDFSLEKILGEIEEKNMKIADKIAASLSDLQKTMITIPLAIIFAAPRVDSNGLQSWTNCLILLSVWLFALFTWAFFSSQKRTLQFIIDEIADQKNVIKEMHPTIAEKISPKFVALERRCSDQKTYRRVIGSLMWLTAVVLTFAFLFPTIKPFFDKCPLNS